MDELRTVDRKTNPIQKANVFSLITFGYTLGLFRKGYRKELEEEDIYEVVELCQSRRNGDNIQKRWDRKQSLMKTVLCQFGISYCILGLISILWSETSNILSPLGLSKVVAYFTPHQKKITKDQVYGYAAILIFLQVGHTWLMNNVSVGEVVLGVRIQAALKSLLYRKVLRMSHMASGKNFGNIVTLITKDINLFEKNMWMIRDFAKFVIDMGTIAYLLYNRIGNPAFIGLGLVFIAVPLQIYLSVKLKKLRLDVAKHSDERLQRMQETLSSMKIIKMYTWEKFFGVRVSDSRKKEVNSLLKVSLINTFIDIVGVGVSKVSFIVLIIIYMGMGYNPSTELIYYIMQIFNQLASNIGVILPSNLSRAAQLHASILRLNDVLHAEEIVKINSEHVEKPTILMKNIFFNLNNREILSGISLHANEPGLMIVTGTVGSGKSSLLKVILQDYQPNKEGILEVSGDISYSSQDPWIFPGSVRQNIIFGEEYHKDRYDQVVQICALDSDISQLEKGDLTILSDKGQNLSKGQQARINLARAVYRDANIYLLDDCLTALDTHVQEFIFNKCLMQFLKDKIVILVTQNPHHIKRAGKVIVLNEGKMVPGNIAQKTSVNEVLYTQTKKVSTTKYEIRTSRKTSKLSRRKLSQVEQLERRQTIYREIKKQGNVDWNTYMKYVRFGGGIIVFGLIISLFIGAQFCDSFSEKLITKWVDEQQTVISLEKKHQTNGSDYVNAVNIRKYTFTVAGIMMVLRNVLYIIKYFVLLWFCRSASINLHKKMAGAIIGATMFFFDTHFIGNILNRMSYDLNNIDETIPGLFPTFGSNLLDVGGSIILVSTVNWIFWIPIIVFLVAVVSIRNVVIRVIRSLKRLEASTRSPLIGHINSSLEGILTIRAYSAEQNLKDEFDRHQDLYTSALMTSRITVLAYHFYMEMISTSLTVVVIARFLFFNHSESAGDVGLALTQVLRLTTHIEYTMRMWADIESNMTSVERAVEYTNLDQESKDGQEIENWPVEGALKFKGVRLCYEGYNSAILKGISFDVMAKEKIGIVGRTGAGKSSIITVLYRLYDFDGSVYIDGIDSKILSLRFLRSNISIIPQDPILFTGTIRENMDPKNRHTDSAIWDIIGRLGINHMFPTLETVLEDGGSCYSSGQKQLICLGRAALAKTKILVLDEATANMDAKTDGMIHNIIDEIFKDCTILMIAHRLNLILNCGKVLLLDRGNIAEFGEPKKLLTDTNSLFNKMFQEYNKD